MNVGRRKVSFAVMVPEDPSSVPRASGAVAYEVATGTSREWLALAEVVLKFYRGMKVTHSLPNVDCSHSNVQEATSLGGGHPRRGCSQNERRVACLYAWQSMERTYRVVVAKPGLDGHDRGAKVIARTLRDAGFEVVYTGLHQTPEQIVQAVIQEDADALGLSLLSGAHLVLVPRIVALLKEAQRDDVLLLVGGIIPDDDIASLERAGVARVFTPGASLAEIGSWLESALDSREAVL